MNPVQFNCPLCAGLFQIDPAMAGGQVVCPNCQGTVTIPALSAPPPAEPPAGAQELSCPLCTGVFQVTPDMAGQQVTCPHCTGLVMIPAPTGAPSVTTPPIGEVVTPAPSYQTVASTPGAPSSTEGSSSPNRNFYPPGFEPKPVVPEKATKPESTPVGPKADHRYPPGQSPKPSSQPTNAAAQPTSQPVKIRDQSSSKALPTEPTAPASRPRTDVDSLLPPGAAGATTPLKETSSPGDAKVDELLPPGASASTGVSPKKRSKADELLPPGAESKSEQPDLKQKALPESEKNRPVKKSQDIVIPTEDGGVATLHEPEKTLVTEGGSQVRLRTLSPEEKTRKRSLKSLVMWMICVLVLIGVLIVLVNK